jgi:PAS domain-containing protein
MTRGQPPLGVGKTNELYSRIAKYLAVEYWSHLVVREGRTLGAVVTFIDITERKQVEAALRKSEERWRSVYENSANASTDSTVLIYEDGERTCGAHDP